MLKFVKDPFPVYYLKGNKSVVKLNNGSARHLLTVCGVKVKYISYIDSKSNGDFSTKVKQKKSKQECDRGS